MTTVQTILTIWQYSKHEFLSKKKPEHYDILNAFQPRYHDLLVCSVYVASLLYVHCTQFLHAL